MESLRIKLFSVKPGITGLWQVKGRSKISYNERVKIDIRYIENIGLFQDLMIFLKTISLIINPFPKKNRGF